MWDDDGYEDRQRRTKQARPGRPDGLGPRRRGSMWAAVGAAVESLESRQLLSGGCPNGPFGLTLAAAAGGNGVAISFVDNSDNEQTFNVERATSAGGPWTAAGAVAGSGDTGWRNFTDATAPAGAQAWYRVYAVNGAYQSSTAGPESILVPSGSGGTTGGTGSTGGSGGSGNAGGSGSTPLGPANPGGMPNGPFGLSANPTSATSVVLTFVDNSNNEQTFVVQRSTAADGNWATIGTAGPYDGTGWRSFTDTAAPAGTACSYRVYAINGIHQSSIAGPASATTPTGSGGTNGGTNGGSTGGSTGGSNGGSSGGTLGGTLGPVNPGGVPNGPFGLAATATSANSVALSFYDNSDNEQAFVILRAASADGPWTPIAYAGPWTGAGARSFTDSTAPAATTSYYRVYAINGIYQSSGDGPTAATTPAASSNGGSGGGTPVTPVAANQLRVSADGHYLIRADGSPFYFIADTAWRMTNRLTPDDAQSYLAHRAAQGFTVIRVLLVDPVAPTNVYGQSPITSNDPTLPNDAYFQVVDQMVHQADALGLYLELFPTFGVDISGPGAIFTAASAQAFGQYLGNRYKSDNVLWAVGGDYPVGGTMNVYDAMADGLIAGCGGTQLVTMQPDFWHSTTSYAAADPRFNFNSIESGQTRDSANYALVSQDYPATPTKPTYDAETTYENIPNSLVDASNPLTDYDVRQKAYWAYLAGAFGVHYGEMDVYQFWTPGMATDWPMAVDHPWQQQLDQPGALEMQYLLKLMKARPMELRVPDQSLLLSWSYDGHDHIQSALASDGSYALLYSAGGQAMTVDLSKLSGPTLTASWYDPRTGTFTPIGTYANQGSATFTPPSQTDWVLVIDNAAKGYSVS